MASRAIYLSARHRAENTRVNRDSLRSRYIIGSSSSRGRPRLSSSNSLLGRERPPAASCPCSSSSSSSPHFFLLAGPRSLPCAHCAPRYPLFPSRSLMARAPRSFKPRVCAFFRRLISEREAEAEGEKIVGSVPDSKDAKDFIAQSSRAR